MFNSFFVAGGVSFLSATERDFHQELLIYGTGWGFNQIIR